MDRSSTKSLHHLAHNTTTMNALTLFGLVCLLASVNAFGKSFLIFYFTKNSYHGHYCSTVLCDKIQHVNIVYTRSYAYKSMYIDVIDVHSYSYNAIIHIIC